MARLTINGQTFETRNSIYGYYDGEPCRIVDLRGDVEAFKSPDTVILQSKDVGMGFVRYWLTSTDEAERAGIARVADAR